MLCEKCFKDSGDMLLCTDCAAEYTEKFFMVLLHTLFAGMSTGELEAVRNEMHTYPFRLTEAIRSESWRRDRCHV
jgi:hypothetical protein